MTLNGVFQAQIAYCEGDRSNPLLEEVVSLLATFFESTGNYRNALYMWHHFAGIQERMFGEDKKEMIMPTKKIATLHSQLGEPLSASKFFERVQLLMEKFRDSDPNQTEEEKKEAL